MFSIYIIILFIINELSFILFQFSIYQFICTNLLIFNELLVENINIIEFCNYDIFVQIFDSILIFDTGYIYVYDFIYEIRMIDLNHIDASHSSIKEQQYYCVSFETQCMPMSVKNIRFYNLQQKLYVLIGESNLSFSRIVNESNYNYTIYSIYTVVPYEYTTYINKIQCFCFEELYIGKNEFSDSPVIFYIDNIVSNLIYYNSLHYIIIEYLLLLTIVT